MDGASVRAPAKPFDQPGKRVAMNGCEKLLQLARGFSGMMSNDARGVVQHAERTHPLPRFVDLRCVEAGRIDNACEPLVFLTLCSFERPQQQVGFLSFLEVAADGFPPAIVVGGEVKQVILNLECAPDMPPDGSKPLCLVLIGATDEPSNFHRTFDESAGLAIDHLEVVVDTDVAPAFENLVERLPFAQPGDHAVEGSNNLAEVSPTRSRE